MGARACTCLPLADAQKESPRDEPEQPAAAAGVEPEAEPAGSGQVTVTEDAAGSGQVAATEDAASSGQVAAMEAAAGSEQVTVTEDAARPGMLSLSGMSKAPKLRTPEQLPSSSQSEMASASETKPVEEDAPAEEKKLSLVSLREKACTALTEAGANGRLVKVLESLRGGLVEQQPFKHLPSVGTWCELRGAKRFPQQEPQIEVSETRPFKHLPSVGTWIATRLPEEKAPPEKPVFKRLPSVCTWLALRPVRTFANVVEKASEVSDVSESPFRHRPSVGTWLTKVPDTVERPWYFQEFEAGEHSEYIGKLQDVIAEKDLELDKLKAQLAALRERGPALELEMSAPESSAKFVITAPKSALTVAPFRPYYTEHFKPWKGAEAICQAFFTPKGVASQAAAPAALPAVSPPAYLLPAGSQGQALCKGAPAKAPITNFREYCTTNFRGAKESTSLVLSLFPSKAATAPTPVTEGPGPAVSPPAYLLPAGSQAQALCKGAPAKAPITNFRQYCVVHFKGAGASTASVLSLFPAKGAASAVKEQLGPAVSPPAYLLPSGSQAQALCSGAPATAPITSFSEYCVKNFKGAGQSTSSVLSLFPSKAPPKAAAAPVSTFAKLPSAPAKEAAQPLKFKELPSVCSWIGHKSQRRMRTEAKAAEKTPDVAPAQPGHWMQQASVGTWLAHRWVEPIQQPSLLERSRTSLLRMPHEDLISSFEAELRRKDKEIEELKQKAML